jgi:hypothetical protein
MKSLRKLHTGKPYVQFERRTEASVRVTSCASSDPSVPNEARRCRDPSRCGEGNYRDSSDAAEFLRGFMLSTPKVLDQIFRGSERKHSRATGMP